MKTTDLTELKGKVALNRIAATLALIGALFCSHYDYAAAGWQELAWGVATGLLCSITISRTLKASIFAAGWLSAQVLVEAQKKGSLR